MFRCYRFILCVVALLQSVAVSAAPPSFETCSTLVASSKGHDILKAPRSVVIDPVTGVVFIADSGHHQIIAIDPNGTASVLAGSGQPGATDGTGSAARFKQPQGLAIDPRNRVIYVADTGNHVIRRVTYEGGVTTFAGSGRGEDRDGAANEAGFKEPVGLALDSARNLYVADSGNDKVRVVSVSGVVTSFAGTGRPGYANGTRSQALFHGPRGVAVDSTGIVYVADTKNQVVRRIASGIVSTLAGTAHNGQVDGPAAIAEFNAPSGVSLDDAGNLWIADTGNHQIRRIGADGVTTTIAGDGRPGYRDGSALLTVQFHEPAATAIAGAIFIADAKNDAVRVVWPSLGLTSFTPQVGRPNGGDVVRIVGSGFVPGKTTVTFGGVSATNVTYVSSSELAVSTPAHAIGDATITVATPVAQAAFATPFRYMPPFVSLTITPTSPSMDIGNTVRFEAQGRSSDNTTTDLTNRVVWSSTQPPVATIDSSGMARAISVGTAAIIATFENLTATTNVTVRSLDPLPPDPAAVATPLEPTVASDLSQSVQFLYTGSNPIQKNATASLIESRRVAVVRGRVLAAHDAPLAGVKVSVLGRSYYGFTLTRADGAYDLAVNGGGDVTLVFEKTGFIAAQRRTRTPWLDFVVLDDVYLTEYDATRTSVQMNAASMQTVRASITNDADGARRATLLIPAQTTAMIRTATGSQNASSLTIRATEFTVGPDGPSRMPAPLPASSAYTYCVELSADEAVALNARQVDFSQPLPFYLDNFLDVPVGTRVPVGYYDRNAGAWMPSDDGIVLQIVSVAGGSTAIDVTGDGVPDDATTYGVTQEELQRLSELYEAGTTLWRAVMTHFTPWDLNFALLPPDDAVSPTNPKPSLYGPVCDANVVCSSVIDCQNQAYGETIPIDGTPFSLHYRSDHNRRLGYTLDVQMSGDAVPQSLKRIELDVTIQGRRISKSFSASANQADRFVWDGKDAYGRRTQGLQTAHVKVSYVYDISYARTEDGIRRSFGSAAAAVISSLRAAAPPEIRLSQEHIVLMGGLNDQPLGFGGWTLDAQKFLEPRAGVLHGSVTGPRASDLQRDIINCVAGCGTATGSGDGGFATRAKFSTLGAVAAAPDGSFYISESRGIRKVSPNGILSTLLPQRPSVMVIGADDMLYYAVGSQVFRANLIFGGVTPLAGSLNSTADQNTDQIPALEATFGTITALAVGPDGSVYIGSNRLRRVAPDGIVYPVTGPTTLTESVNPEGRSAIRTNPGPINGLAVSQDGTIYFTVGRATGRRVYAISAGLIRRFAGTGTENPGDDVRDGGPATDANLNYPGSLAMGADGSLYVADENYWTIRRILPNGNISTIAGQPFQYETLGEGGPAAASHIFYPEFFAVGPAGIVVSDQFQMTVRKVGGPLATDSGGAFRIPSTDGAIVDVFTAEGRHTSVVDAITGVSLRQLAYDSRKQLTSVTDAYGNAATVERDASGNASAIVGPFGVRVTLDIDTEGRLRSVTAPPDRRYELNYNEQGLLSSIRNPRGIARNMTYDDLGRLLREELPDGGAVTLSRANGTNDRSFKVTIRSGEQNAIEHQFDRSETGAELRVTKNLNTGLVTTTTLGADGASSASAPDGTTVTTTITPDPRFQSLAPLRSMALRTPSGRTFTAVTGRIAERANATDPLSAVRAVTDTWAMNGQQWSSKFTIASRTSVTRSPMGRTLTALHNAQGDIVSASTPGLATATYGYDTRGRLSTINIGSRSFSMTYRPSGELESVTDSLSRTVGLEYDDAARTSRVSAPGGLVTTLGYDPNGNVVAVAPPSRSSHVFTYSARDQQDSYRPPGGGLIRFTYNHGRQLTGIIDESGQLLAMRYDAAGRTESVSGRDVSYMFRYSPTSGQLQEVSGPADVTLSYLSDGPLPERVTWTGAVSGQVAYSYDQNLRLSSEYGTAFTYDLDGLLTGAGALTLQRDSANGLLRGTTLGAITDTFAYNEFGEIAGYKATHSDTLLLAFTYSRDAAGRIVADGTYAYDYDTAGRLTRVRLADSLVAEYDYDANGNRTAHRFIGGSATGRYDGQDRLVAYGDVTYDYDLSGNLSGRTMGGESTIFAYNAAGSLRAVESRSQRIEYVIDGRGRRVGKKLDGILVQGWLYGDQLRVIAELDGSSQEVARFVYGSRANVPDYVIRDGVSYRILADNVGSPRLVVNVADGTIVQRIDYDAYGQITVDTNPSFQPFRFAGGLYDRDTGLVHLGARDYDPHTGRFITRDPIVFAGGDGNLYAYSGNDPINAIDPTGLLFGGAINAGEAYGEAALGTYADILSDPNAAWYETAGAAVGGFFAALWTPCTSDATFTTLSVASGAGAWARQPYWRYVGPRSNPNGGWLTRGWKAPYGTNYARAKDALQLPHTPTGVVRVQPRLFEPVAGPRTVGGNPTFGAGGGTEYFRGWRFPTN